MTVKTSAGEPLSNDVIDLLAQADRLLAAIDASQEGEHCAECNGTGNYVGLNESEPCRSCRGKGFKPAPQQLHALWYPDPYTERMQAMQQEAAITDGS